MTDSRARQSAFRSAPVAPARAAAPVSRAQAIGGHAVTRAKDGGGGKKGESFFEKDDDKDADDKKGEKVEKVGNGAAGSAGDFKPMSGDLWGDDSNADKGNTPAANDTGVPHTPSGA